MTNKEILKKAIKKAEGNGFDSSQYIPAIPSKLIDENKFLNVLMAQKERIIFSREFAKAFFGEGEADVAEEYVCSDQYCSASAVKWQYHLQQLVLEEDPIKYLEKFI